MKSEDVVWTFGKPLLGFPAAVATRLRSYGAERMPRSGGAVLAINHFSWIDIPCIGYVSPRNLYFLAKVEAHRVPGLGQVIRGFGTLAVRRGESDREAVRRMREVVRDGNVLGVFVEGTRQRSGVPEGLSHADRGSYFPFPPHSSNSTPPRLRGLRNATLVPWAPGRGRYQSAHRWSATPPGRCRWWPPPPHRAADLQSCRARAMTRAAHRASEPRRMARGCCAPASARRPL